MHLMRCKNAFLHQMHFCVHFPKENVQQTKMLESGKMHFGCAKMHFNILLMQKCKNKMYASHFPKENVQLCKNAFDALQKCILASNAFDAKMHFGNAYILLCKMFSITFSFGKCDAKMHFCTAKMHFCIKCILASNAFDAALTFCWC